MAPDQTTPAPDDTVVVYISREGSEVADLQDLVDGREGSLPWVGQRNGHDVPLTLLLSTTDADEDADLDDTGQDDAGQDGTSGQDRDDYTDTQDRDDYTVDPTLHTNAHAAPAGGTPDPLTDDIAQAIARAAGLHGIAVDARLLAALAPLVAACAKEVPSTDPDDCRWTVTYDNTYSQGHDHLAGALGAALELYPGDHSSTITIRRQTP